jgi:hypothetical protein
MGGKFVDHSNGIYEIIYHVLLLHHDHLIFNFTRIMLKNCRSLTLNRNHSSLQKLLLFLRQNISDQEEKSQKERERENQALPNMA